MEINIPEPERKTFATALRCLNEAGLPYVVAGAFCQHYYTGFWRYTKDMDLFALPEVVPAALKALKGEGFNTWIEADHWLGKATMECCMVDLIFGSGNWLSPIDSVWLDRARPATLFGVPVRMAPLEEMIWAKSYICGRERYDGADVCHLIMSSRGKLDWRHLVTRYGEHWQLLLAHLNMYRFIYPSNKDDIPASVMADLNRRVARQQEEPVSTHKVCRGTLLDRFSYNYDVEQLGYHDARERYAEASGSTVHDVATDRAWAADKLARGEVYRRE